MLPEKVFLFGVKNNIFTAPFMTPNINIFSRKILKSERVLSVLREHIVLNVKGAEIFKMSEIF